MTEAFDTDVLIAGAGATGLVLAIELARRGVAFQLIDQAEGPFLGSRGKGIQPRTLEIFEDLGVLNRMAATGGAYPVTRTYRGDAFEDEHVMESVALTPAEPYTTPLLLPQFLTEGILRERLAELGQAPRFGCTLTGFESHADGVTAQVKTDAGTQTVHARYLVGADGGRSFVRHALNVGFPGNTLQIRAIVADIDLVGLTRDFWHRWGDGDMQNQIALCPLIGTDLFQLQAPIPLEGEPELSPAGLTAMIAARTHRNDLAVRSVRWVSAYNMNARLADAYRVGPVLLAGDAAHIHPPTGGQGLNTSVQDAYNLGWKLAAVLRGAPAALLDTYETERRPIAEGVLGLSTRLLDAAKERNMRRGRETQQLDLGYPESPLSLDTRDGIAKLSAGDRAPDAPCQGAGGQPTRLFNLFAGPHWTLLGYETEGASPIAPAAGLHIHRIGATAEIRDNNAHIRDAYDLQPGTWALIRPDGYIGALTSDGNALRQYLASVGLS